MIRGRSGRRSPLWLLALTVLLGLSGPVFAAEEKQPTPAHGVEPSMEEGAPEAEPLALGETDVLLLTLCTVRADHLGAYGYERPTSPIIDRLAELGVVFERMMANAPWTRPSIASMITGLYPRSLEIDEPRLTFNNRSLEDSFETLAEHMQAAGYSTIGVTANPNANASFGFDQGYDLYRDTGVLWRDGYQHDKVSARQVVAVMLQYLRQLPPDRRFFANLITVDAHVPYRNRIADTAEVEVFGRREIDRYDRQIRYTDQIIGHLTRKLAELGRTNLLIIITADHGEAFARHRPGDKRHGEHLYDTTIWVPFILYHPQLAKQPRRITTHVEGVDITPTVLGLLGMRAGPEQFEGRSLAGAVLHGEELSPLPLYTVETAYRSSNRSAVLSDGMKLIVDWMGRDAPRFELYRRESDPHETSNLAEQEPEAVQRLLDQLSAWRSAHPGRAGDEVERTELSKGEEQALRSLGYIED
jgi:choline-sulfatase